MTRRSGVLLIAILASIAALEPVGTQMLLPALPSIQAGFGASAGTAQLALSLAVLVMAFTHLAYGPWSDRVGRRPVVIFGVVLFVAGNVVAAIAPSIEIVILGRVIQAAGASVGIVMSRVIAVDVFRGERAASAVAMVQAVMAFAPLFAPVTSGLLTDHVGWRSTFVVLSVLGVAILVLVVAGLKESHPTPSRDQGLGQILHDFRTVGCRPLFLAYGLHSAFTFGIFFAYMGAAPYVIITVFGTDATTFGLWMLLVVGGFIVGNLLSVRLNRRVAADRLITIGTVVCLVMLGVAAGLLWAGNWAPWALFVPGTLVAVGAGLATPNSQALAVRVGESRAGTASGLVGFLLLIVGGLAVQAVGWAQDDTPYPMMIALLVLATLALASIVVRRTVLRHLSLPSTEDDATA